MFCTTIANGKSSLSLFLSHPHSTLRILHSYVAKIPIIKDIGTSMRMGRIEPSFVCVSSCSWMMMMLSGSRRRRWVNEIWMCGMELENCLFGRRTRLSILFGLEEGWKLAQWKSGRDSISNGWTTSCYPNVSVHTSSSFV